MNGIENIVRQLTADAEAEAQAVLAEAKAKAEAIAADYAGRAQTERENILAQGKAQARERADRMESMAGLEGRKTILAAKQDLISQAFDKALKKLNSLPQDEYVDLLAAMCAKAAVTGREEVIFSEKDRKTVGKAVVDRANAILAKGVAPKLPEELTATTAGAILDKVVTAGSAILAGTAMLTIADETRPIRGGFILSDEGVEINCAFDVLTRLDRPKLERQVADLLFEEA